jgi:hypothetical protein
MVFMAIASTKGKANLVITFSNTAEIQTEQPCNIFITTSRISIICGRE